MSSGSATSLEAGKEKNVWNYVYRCLEKGLSFPRLQCLSVSFSVPGYPNRARWYDTAVNTTILLPWGPFTISALSLSFSAAIIVSLMAVIVAGRRAGLPFQRFIDFILIGLVCGIVGGRLAHILIVDRNYYFQHPDQIIRFQDGGISFWGGFLVSLVVAIIWACWRKYSVKPYLDVFAPALTLGLSIGGIGYPWPDKIMAFPYPWGIVKEGCFFHPLGAYAIVLLMLLYFFLIRRQRRVHYKGELMLLFIVGYGLINLVIDYFSVLPAVWGRLTAGQLVSLMMIVVAVINMIGGSKAYSSSYYFNRKISPPPPSRIKLFFRLLWSVMIIGGQLYLYFLVSGFPEGIINRMSL